MKESHLSPLGPKMIVVFQLNKRVGSHAERHTSDSEWGSIKAEPVWASLTGAETALASIAGMKIVTSSLVAELTRTGQNGDDLIRSTRRVRPRLAAWGYHKLCSGT
jgi:hypothetical protein